MFPWLESILEKINYSVYCKEFEHEYHQMFERGFKDHINHPEKVNLSILVNRSIVLYINKYNLQDSDILKLMMQAQVTKKETSKATKGFLYLIRVFK